MNSKDLIKRLFTSIPLLFLLGLSFKYSYFLIISLILLTFVSWLEFQNLISKILKKKDFKENFYKISLNGLILIYLTIFSLLVYSGISQSISKIEMVYLFSICICSDVGGLLFGKLFKGKKLTKISPNKTISGSIGSFTLSLFLVPVFYFFLNDQFINLFHLIILSILVSFFCQIGDLFISLLKRKAKVKNTGNILPGHGGLLDRIDGMLLAVPLGIFLWKILIIII